MRRSQRLMKYRDVRNKAERLDKSSNSITDDRNAKQHIQNFERKTDNGSNSNEFSLPQLSNSISDGQSIDVKKDTWNKSSKTNAKVQEVNTNNSNTTEENKATMRSQNNKRCTAAPSSSTTRRGRKRGTSRSKINRQNKKMRTAAISNEFEVKAPFISIDNYFNPIRNPLMQVANAQTRLNNDFYCHNTNMPTNYLQTTKDSLLPPMYPNHFVNQNYNNSFINQQQLQSFAALDANIQPAMHFPTPDLTQSLDFDSSTSTISLSDSLRELFGCDDIRDVLKLDKVIFRMSRLHLQTLAFVLNIEFDYLHSLIEKIMKLDTETLQKVIFAFQPEANQQNDTVTNE
ncbi:uncharacterized protein LOC105220913 [Zeugodacus cucurbitae]|uniref:Uncharacterized protein n=1 Tax=Zeugodacus cucurbitae TaxID=28588 RepID=A0A0A1WKA5_ZEUCU|nr:uncharacterized protein LOC105220913 [Zeugodacus cucurbitae]